MPKINQEEYKLLKEIKRNGFEEIRRNSTGDIAVRVIGEKVTSHQYPTEHNDKFKFLKATGDYWSIPELIEEYEEDYKGSWEHAIEFSKEMRRESEETEVKNIEWLKEEVEKRIKTIESDDISFVGSEYYDEGYIDGMRDVLYRINQLDEPETLSFDWIDVNKKDSGVHYIGYYVPIGRLHDLLVPKQELPVIPKFVADWIEASRDAMYHLLGAVYDGAYSEDMKEWLFKGDKRTRQDNQDKLTRAWLHGYEIEVEGVQKYYAKVKGWGVNGNDGHAYYSGKFPLSLTMSTESVAHTKDEWKKYGVYEDNADFVKVEELEE